MSSGQNPTDFASLPNSRNSSRTSTKNSDTFASVAIFDDAAGPLDTSDPSFNETDVANRGIVTTNGNTLLIEKNRTRTFLILRNIDSAETIVYGHVDRPTLKDDGMILRAGEPVEIDSKNPVYVKSVATDSSDINLRIEFGLG